MLKQGEVENIKDVVSLLEFYPDLLKKDSTRRKVAQCPIRDSRSSYPFLLLIDSR